MTSKEFYNYLSKIRFATTVNPDDDYEELKAYDIASDNGKIVNPTYSKVKIIFPLGSDDYGKKEFVEEGIALLQKNKLSSSPKIFYCILLGFDFYKKHPTNAIKNSQAKFIGFVNQCTKISRVFQAYVFKQIVQKLLNSPFLLDSFEIGGLDFFRFKSLIENETESDYHLRFLEDFQFNEEEGSGHFSFTRSIRDLYIIDFYQLYESKMIDYQTLNLLNDLYFEAHTIKLIGDFWSDFEKEQKVSVAYGSPYFDSLKFKYSQSEQGVQIAVYHRINKEKRGWVIPFRHFINRLDFNFQYNQDDTNNRTSKLYECLKSNSDFSGILNQMINFLSKGNFELGEGKFSEALLNYWVALDIILNNTEEGNSLILKNRVSSLLWFSEKSNHSSTFFKIQKSYNIRSKYVHAGELANENDAVFLRSVCQTILDILIRIHSNALKNKSLTYDSWIIDLDELIHAGRNSTSVPQELLQKIGIIEI